MWTMPQIGVQKILENGMAGIKGNLALIDEIFGYLNEDYLVSDYGPTYTAKIKSWFAQTKVPVLHAWSFNAERIPCISVHLAQESEDESKAAMGDIWGMDENGMVGVANFNCQIDIGIHASKTSDQVLWLYYITSYILFTRKQEFINLGMQLQTYTASDWDRAEQYSVENIWTRWIRMRCTSNNFWTMQPYTTVDSIDTELSFESNTED